MGGTLPEYAARIVSSRAACPCNANRPFELGTRQARVFNLRQVGGKHGRAWYGVWSLSDVVV
jgi:hypothetical protein